MRRGSFRWVKMHALRLPRIDISAFSGLGFSEWTVVQRTRMASQITKNFGRSIIY
jgi:hypothetical protein